MFRVGDRETVRCTVKECAHTPHITWEGKEDRPLFVEILTRDSESVLLYKSVQRHHENRLQCKASCEGQEKIDQVTVKVFSFPEVPRVFGLERVVAGEEVRVGCEAGGVYPAEYTDMKLLLDEHLLVCQEGTSETHTLEAKFIFTPTRQDHGHNVTCRAKHHLPGVPATRSSIQATITLSVLYPPGVVQVSGAEVVEVGAPLTLRCSAEGQPPPQMQWRFLGSQGQWEELGRGPELHLLKVSHDDAGHYECQASNGLGQNSTRLHLSVLGPPRNTSLRLSPPQPIREGESVRFSCQTASAPMGELHLLREGERGTTELLAVGEGELDFILTNAQLNQSGRYTCHASNCYGNQTSSTNLTVTVFPLQVEVVPGGMVTTQLGSTLSLTCAASGCPHAQLSWEAPPPVQWPHPSAPRSNLSVDNPTGPWSNQSLSLDDPVQEGVYSCHAHCGSAHVSQQMRLRLFSFPSAPIIEHSGWALEGEVTVFRCVVHDVYPPASFHIRWLYRGEELTPQTPPELPPTRTTATLTSSVTMVMKPSHRGRQLSCQVELLMEGVPKQNTQRSANTTIDVHHPPRNTSLRLSTLQPIREAGSVRFSCRTASAPVGGLRLLREGKGGSTELLAVGGGELDFTLTNVQLNQSGRYTCHASNRYGNQTSSTNLIVTAPPRDTVVEVLPSAEVMEGDNITICCRSISYPPPLVTLTKLSNNTHRHSHSHTNSHTHTHSHTLLSSPNGTFHLSHLTPSDAGKYLVNVSNHLGHHTHIFSIIVTGRCVWVCICLCVCVGGCICVRV
ncbi:hypothetical protein ACEWY4_013968 [Coilia grayii]|uniref:Ig-like domain-containing protein n=1 Tax=Coilia grayii TaxID=363190 RepID=A0ABD1JQY3_9TELE